MRRLLLLCSAIVLVDAMFFAAITPLLPYYADRYDLSKAEAGVLSAAYAAGALIAALPAGVFAARFGVRRAVLAGLVLMAVASFGFAFATSVLALDVARFVQGVGSALSWAGAFAWLVAAAPPDRRGELIGAALGAAISGALLGPVLGALANLAGPEPVFSAVAVLAAGLAIWALRTPAAESGGEGSLRSLVPALRSPGVRAGMWLVTLPALLFSTMGVLGSLRLDQLGASGLAIGATFLVAAGFEAVMSPLTGRLADRRGRWLPIRAGLAASAVVTAMLAVPDAALLLAALLVLGGGAYGLFWTPAMALLSDSADAAHLHQGLAFALVNLAWGTGAVAGGAAGGALADATSDAVPYALLAVLCTITLVLTRSLAGARPGAVAAAS